LGVQSVGWIPLRLPHEVAPLFREWLAVHYPERAGKVMSIVREMRGGRDNDPNFHSRMNPQGVWADLIRARFRVACRKAGIAQGKNRPRFVLDTARFRPPESDRQMRLL
jgi:DNA repair photolyase